MIEIRVDAHGAIVDGFAVAEITRYTRHVEDVLGDRAVTMIRAYLPSQYMYLGHNGGDPRHNPIPADAGRLQESIHTERSVADSEVVVGDAVTYGAWIEGVSSLNAVVWPGRARRGLSSRFPGYHTFRVMTQVLRDVAVDIAYSELPTYIEEINTY